jgi:oligosaccharide repeat unit polymerase
MSWNVLYALDLFAISTFAISYYRNCYRKGYRFDFWHLQLFFGCVLPNMLMVPFARSEANAVVLFQDFGAVVAVLPDVFLITLLGYFAMLAGGTLWRLRVGFGMRRTAMHLLEFVPRCSIMLMSFRSLLVFYALLCFSLQMLILGMYFAHDGFGFDLRSYTFANPTMRPIALVISYSSVIIASHCFARYTDRKERVLLVCTLLLSFGLVFFGQRANILIIYFNVLLCYLVRLRDRINLFRISASVVISLMVALYLGNVRAGQYSLSEFFGMLAILLFYGNNFSDLRDFAWVYAKWDHVFWAGKTYLAAFTSFVPRFASEFRDTWAVGVKVDTTVGLDPTVHPGLRPGTFGEGFFNFGLLGVVAVGLILGVVSRRVDIDVKCALTPPQSSMSKAFASTMLIGVAGNVAISGNFSAMYILGGIYLSAWLCLRVQRMVQLRNIAFADAD